MTSQVFFRHREELSPPGPSAAQGDEMSWDSLYRSYAPSLRRFCKGRLGGNAHDAEDACHETILRAYRALPRFRPGAMWPWLATIAANICVDMTKKRARTIWLDDDRLDSRRDEPWAEGPEDEAARRARVMVIREALTQLPDRYRAVVRMRDYDGWSYREMAEFLGTSVAAVESLLVRARRALRGHVSRRLAGAAS